MLLKFFEILFLIVMLYGCIIDWKTRLVNDKTWIAASILSLIIAVLRGYTFLEILKYSSWLFIVFLIVELINWSITKTQGVGGGDFLIAPATTLFYGPLGSKVMCLVFILSLIGQVFSKQTDEKYIPLVSYFFIGSVIVFLFNITFI